MHFDLIIAGGTVADGTGAPGYPADVGVKGDRIVAVGDLHDATARDTIDATALVVAPGFIDPHNHANNEAEGGILSIPRAENQVRQGVTTLIAGNCGGCNWPVAEHLAAVEQCDIRQNYATLLGMGTLRAQVVQDSGRPANTDELAQMQRLVDQGMEEGAIGMSTGYFPAHVTTDEIAELTTAVARNGGVYSSHVRNEGDGLLGSIEEIIQIGVRAELPVQVSHIKTYGRRNWFKIDAVLATMEAGQRRGVDVKADRYPYVACFTGLASVLPMWARTEAITRGQLKSADDEAWNARVRRAVADQFDLIGGPQNVMFAPLVPDPRLDGKRLSQYAEELGQDPIDVAIDLIQAAAVSCIYFTMSEDNIETFYRHPLVMGGSDGHLREFGKGVSHPRNYGTMPRIIGHYGRDRGLFAVEEAVRKCTSMAAERWGLKGRGVLAEGHFADIVVFSWEDITDRATFEDQHRYPEGIPWVIVNGGIAVANGATTDGCYGRVIRQGQ